MSAIAPHARGGYEGAYAVRVTYCRNRPLPTTVHFAYGLEVTAKGLKGCDQHATLRRLGRYGRTIVAGPAACKVQRHNWHLTSISRSRFLCATVPTPPDTGANMQIPSEPIGNMQIPTEPIGSIPRPLSLIEAITAAGDGTASSLDALYDAATRDTISSLEATGSPVITDGEQRKYHNFWTYSVQGLANTAPDGFKIPFAAGHVRRMPRLTGGPFRYRRYADSYLDLALSHARVPVKQAVIAPSALSLMYPEQNLPNYPREAFIEDLIREHAVEVRRCLQRGAHSVQVDFTEARLAIKADPTGSLLASFIDLNNLALSQLSSAERLRVGVHTCPGGDLDSTHSADIDYSELLPSLFQLNATNFYVALAGERDRIGALRLIQSHLKPHHRIFVGVTSPIDPTVETVEQVRDRVLEAARYIPLHQLGTTDDCGFAPFSDDTSTSRETAFAKIRARVEGTKLAADILGEPLVRG